MRRFVRWSAIAVFVAAVPWLAASFAALGFARSRKSRCAEPLTAELASTFEEIQIDTRDGERLGAWFCDATDAGAPSVVELHGNGGTRKVRLGAAQVCRERGCAVLLVTLRAHGDSSGERLDFGWSSRHDVVAAVEWLEHRRPGAPIVLHGASLGAASAVFAAQELGPRVDAYLLECLYRDLDSAAWNRCALYLPPVLDALAYAGLRTAASLAWPDWQRISPLEAIANVPRESRLVLLAGSEDRHARLDEQRELFARVAERAQLVVIDGAAHDRLQSCDPAAYRAAVLACIEPLCARASSSPRR